MRVSDSLEGAYYHVVDHRTLPFIIRLIKSATLSLDQAAFFFFLIQLSEPHGHEGGRKVGSRFVVFLFPFRSFFYLQSIVVSDKFCKNFIILQ